MLSNEERGLYGAAAVEAGSPDHGQNGDDFDGAYTDAGDAIANILHHLFQVNPDQSLDEREAAALGVLERGRLHFTAELRGDI